MTAASMTTHPQATRGHRRQLHQVELQGLDASRIITGLSGRGGRTWPTTSHVRQGEQPATRD